MSIASVFLVYLHVCFTLSVYVEVLCRRVGTNSPLDTFPPLCPHRNSELREKKKSTSYVCAFTKGEEKELNQ